MGFQELFESFQQNLLFCLSVPDEEITLANNSIFLKNIIPQFENLKCFQVKIPKTDIECSLGASQNYYSVAFFRAKKMYFYMCLDWIVDSEENYLSVEVCVGNTLNYTCTSYEKTFREFLDHPNVKHFLQGNLNCENNTLIKFCRLFKNSDDFVSEINIDILRHLCYTGNDSDAIENINRVFDPLVLPKQIKNARLKNE